MAKKATTAAAPPAETKPDAPTQLRSNSEIIREILESGVEKPAEIERIGIEKYKVAIEKGLINNVKVAWKKKKAQQSGVTTTASADERGNGKKKGGVNDGNTKRSGDERGNGKLDAAMFCLKMGGVDAAIAALNELKKEVD